MKLSIKVTLLALAIGALGWVLASASPVSHTTSVSGTVASVVPVGQAVKEGDVLVTVNTLAGPVPAARATVNGTVTAVAVQGGASISQGQEVAVVESK